MLSVFDLSALLLVLTALFGWINRRFFGFQHSVGLLVTGLMVSLLLVGLEVAFPEEILHREVALALLRVDFTDVVMNGMLAFLLFAGALDVDLGALRDRAAPVAVLALIGTAISTAVVGIAMWAIAGLAGAPLPLAWALVFGALISPTDPVAVLATLRAVRIPRALEIELQGEALFNDGVGVVLFTLLLAVAGAAGGGEADGAGAILELVVREIAGGIALGLAAGFIAYRAMKAIDDFPVEVLITLALVAGTYALAQRLGTSGPLAVVAAGLLIGDRGTRFAMSERTEGYVTALWRLIDEVLNSMLFLLIGLEVLVLRFETLHPIVALAAVPAVIAARALAVAAPLLAKPLLRRLSVRNLPFITWAGVRGGISVALALSLPDGPEKAVILAATYAVVLFSILVQAPTLPALARRTIAEEQIADTPARRPRHDPPRP